jgi:hypothetical protein
MHDEKRPGDLRKVPGDPLDDVADSARYGLYTYINAAEEPHERVDYDYLKLLAHRGDLTSALINYQRMTETPPDGLPAYWGGARFRCIASTLAHQSGILLKSIETTEVETRLARLEEERAKEDQSRAPVDRSGTKGRFSFSSKPYPLTARELYLAASDCLSGEAW